MKKEWLGGQSHECRGRDQRRWDAAAAKAPESRATFMHPKDRASSHNGLFAGLEIYWSVHAGLQTCFGPVTPSFLPFSPIRNGLRLWEMLGWGGCILKVGPK